jgi:hypothetical protein
MLKRASYADDGSKAPVDITNYNSGMRNWFKENLPFKILNQECQE